MINFDEEQLYDSIIKGKFAKNYFGYGGTKIKNSKKTINTKYN